MFNNRMTFKVVGKNIANKFETDVLTIFLLAKES